MKNFVTGQRESENCEPNKLAQCKETNTLSQAPRGREKEKKSIDNRSIIEMRNLLAADFRWGVAVSNHHVTLAPWGTKF